MLALPSFKIWVSELEGDQRLVGLTEAQHDCSGGSREGRGVGLGWQSRGVMMRPLKGCNPQGTPVTNPVESS